MAIELANMLVNGTVDPDSRLRQWAESQGIWNADDDFRPGPASPVAEVVNEQRTRFVPASCPSCGGDLQLPSSRDQVKCMYCGRDIVIANVLGREAASGGTDIAALRTLAEVAEQSGNFTEAYRYFTRIIEVEPDDADAWVGIGVAAGALSTLMTDRLEEMCCAFGQAIQLASTENQVDLSRRITSASSAVAVALHEDSREHMAEFVDVPGAWVEHLDRTLAIGNSLLTIEALTGNMPETLRSAIAIVERDLRGFQTLKCDYGSLLPRVEVRKPPREYRSALSAILQEASARLQRTDPSVCVPDIRHDTTDFAGMVVVGIVGLALTTWAASQLDGPLAVGVTIGGLIGIPLACAQVWAASNKR